MRFIYDTPAPHFGTPSPPFPPPSIIFCVFPPPPLLTSPAPPPHHPACTAPSQPLKGRPDRADTRHADTSAGGDRKVARCTPSPEAPPRDRVSNVSSFVVSAHSLRLRYAFFSLDSVCVVDRAVCGWLPTPRTQRRAHQQARAYSARRTARPRTERPNSPQHTLQHRP